VVPAEAEEELMVAERFSSTREATLFHLNVRGRALK